MPRATPNWMDLRPADANETAEAWQDADYRESVLPLVCSTRLAVEAGVTMGREGWLGDGGQVIGLNYYGPLRPHAPS